MNGTRNGDPKMKFLDDFMAAMARELTISEAMFDKCKTSYKAVGKWLEDGLDCGALVYPQGSMALGTTIRPLSDKEDYDVDLVCLLREFDEKDKPGLVKKVVGDRLKAHELYKDKIDAVGEKKRCWTMEYDGFHMDILPCVPRNGIYAPRDDTAIHLTHRDKQGIYRFLPSDPEKYRDWFVDRMLTESTLLVENKRFSAEVRPLRQVGSVTSLQKAVCILKRHRDVMFESQPDIKPISIIVTTLAAQAYRGQSGVFRTLVQLLSDGGMRQFIRVWNGSFYIPNPVLPEENFAEKWKGNPSLSEAMFRWLAKAKKDLVDTPLTKPVPWLYDWFKEVLEEAPVVRVLNSMRNLQKPIVASKDKPVNWDDSSTRTDLSSSNGSPRISERAPGEQFPEERFQMSIHEPLGIDCEVTQSGFRDYFLSWFLRGGKTRNLAQNKQLRFFVKPPYPKGRYEIYWKVRNRGPEAIRRHCERGAIIKGRLEQIEHTNFTGDHYVECYLVRDGVCTACDHIPVPINVAVQDDEHRLT